MCPSPVFDQTTAGRGHVRRLSHKAITVHQQHQNSPQPAPEHPPFPLISAHLMHKEPLVPHNVTTPALAARQTSDFERSDWPPSHCSSPLCLLSTGVTVCSWNIVVTMTRYVPDGISQLIFGTDIRSQCKPGKEGTRAEVCAALACFLTDFRASTSAALGRQ